MAQRRGGVRDCRDFQISSAATWEDSPESLEAVVGPQWRSHWVTPLRDLQYTEARLKQYAMHLRGALQTEETAARIEASVLALPELKQADADEAPVPLQISVESWTDENTKKSLYTGIMLSWTKSPRSSDLNNFVHLPLLLCRGGMKATECVHKMLHILFNCYIKAMTFEKEHMLWMLGLSTHFHTAGSDDLHLRFIFPGMDGRIDATINLEILKDFWKSIHRPDTEYITYDKILDLAEKCWARLKEPYSIKFEMLHLTRIECKDFLFSVEGHVKFSREMAEVLLEFIQDVGYIEGM